MGERYSNGHTLLKPGDLGSWHPLDGCGEAPDYIPRSWDGPHVAKRLVEGLRTLSLLPASQGPKPCGNFMLHYSHDWADLLAQEEAEAEQKDGTRQSQNRSHIRPSAIEIGHMEASIVWPWRYVGDTPQLLSAVQLAALGRARHRDMTWAAHKLALPERLVRRWNRDGLDVIARGLRRDKVAIF